ncbi:MAG: response regulator [Bryobacteraceae bacterium]|jgi:two-component system response regulator
MNDRVQILLVDDNPSDAELTLHVLSRHFAGRIGGNADNAAERIADHIKVVHDGAEALDFIFCTGAYAARNPQDLPQTMLLDLKLPKVDGLEVLRRAKADPRTRDMPIVVFSSSWEDSDVRQARALGAHSFVVKPVDFTQFVEAVRAALNLTEAL